MEAGYLLILATNQLPDIARGAADAGEVSAMHDHLRRYLRLHDVKVCPHDDAPRSASAANPSRDYCWKPARDWNIDLGASFFVGDRWRDIEAGQSAGCQAMFIDPGCKEERRPGRPVPQRAFAPRRGRTHIIAAAADRSQWSGHAAPNQFSLGRSTEVDDQELARTFSGFQFQPPAAPESPQRSTGQAENRSGPRRRCALQE